MKVAVEDRVAVVTVEHPPVNALNRQTVESLDQAIEALKTNQEVKVVIITGAGSLAFIAGADVKEMSQLASAQEARDVSARGQQVFLKLEQLGKPVIAAINGVCFGGGLELAMACHIRICGDRVRLGQPEIDLGIIPGWGGTQRLVRIVGKAKAVEWILTGEKIAAQEAYRLGLVNQVVPQDRVLKVAKDLAKKIAAKPGVALTQALQAIDQGLEGSVKEGMAIEAKAFETVSESADAQEGIKAFLEKRQPQFRDQ